MSAQALPTPRTVRAPLRIDKRTVVSLLVTLIGVLGILFQASANAATRPVLVAARDLPIGATLVAGDLLVVQVRVDETIYAAAVPGELRQEAVGRQLAEPLHQGQIVVRAQLRDRQGLAADQLAFTIPVKSEAAVGGRLREGDEVLVLGTRNKGRPDSTTTVVLERVRVYSTGREDRPTVLGTSTQGAFESQALTSVTLIVTVEQAKALANAKHNSELDLALLPATPHTTTER